MDNNSSAASQSTQDKTNSATASSTDQTDAQKQSSKTGAASESTAQQDTQNLDSLLGSVRRDTRNSERRKTMKLMREAGIEVDGKNYDDVLSKVLKGEITPKKQATKSTDATVTDKQPKTQDDSNTRLAQQRAEQAEQRVQDLAIENAITRATIGVEFANPAAAEDAHASFMRSYIFELSDDGKSVRVLKQNGDPILRGYAEATVGEAFEDFLKARPHLKKADAKPGQTATASKGTTQTAVTMNEILRKAL